MANEIKWIKLSTNLFDNRKIRQIEKMPEGDGMIVIWLQLLCLAGTINDCGMVYFTSDIPYTDQMLSAQFDRPIALVQLALRTFQKFNMVYIADNILMVSNWEKYQNVNGMDKIREQNRLRKQSQRVNEKLIESTMSRDMSRDCHVTVTPCHATDKDIDKDKEEDKDKELGYTGGLGGDGETENALPQRHKYGAYSNVLLSDDDMGKLQSEFPNDWQQRTERLSEYIASTGKTYKSHLATIRSWSRRDEERGKKGSSPSSNPFLDLLNERGTK